MSRRNEGIPKGEIKQNVSMKLREWLVLASHGRFVDEVDVKKLTRPEKIGTKVVPSDLNSLTLGELMQLQEMRTERDAFVVPCRVLFGMSDEEVMEQRATDVVRLASWVGREMERIGKLWERCNVEPTEQQKRAGIDRLQFGMFGIIDSYARRMGITNHEEVESVPWMRVWKCMDMDAETMRYEKRLNHIYRIDNERGK